MTEFFKVKTIKLSKIEELSLYGNGIAESYLAVFVNISTKQLASDVDDLEGQLEKHDTLALILSALFTFLPAALIALGLICLIGWLFIFR